MFVRRGTVPRLPHHFARSFFCLVLILIFSRNMAKKSIYSVVAGVLLFPLIAQGAALDTLRGQIQTLIDQINAIEREMGIASQSSFLAQSLSFSGPSVVVSSSPSFATSTVITSSRNVEVGRFKVNASQSSDDLRIITIQLRKRTNAGNALTRLVLKDGNTVLNTGSNEVALSNVRDEILTFNLDNALIVPEGQIKEIGLYADVSSTAQVNTFYIFDVSKNVNWSVASVVSGSDVSETFDRSIDGKGVIVQAYGGYKVGFEPVMPVNAEQWVSDGRKGVTLNVLKFTATAEPMALTDLRLQVDTTGSSTAADYEKIYIYDGPTLVAIAPSVDKDGYVNVALSTACALSAPSGCFVVDKDSSKLMTIRVDLPFIELTHPGTAGQLIGLDFAGDPLVGYPSPHRQKATGSLSGVSVHSSTRRDVEGNGAVTFRALPMVTDTQRTFEPLNGDQTILRFKVKAMGGEIKLNRLMFRIATSGITSMATQLPSFRLYSITNGNFVSFATGANFQYFAQRKNYDTSNRLIVRARVDETRNYTAGEYRIPAESEHVLELRGTVADDGVLGGSVSVELLGDDRRPEVIRLKGQAAYPRLPQLMAKVSMITRKENSSIFVWSDLSSEATSAVNTNSVHTADWMNGYHVPGLSATGVDLKQAQVPPSPGTVPLSPSPGNVYSNSTTTEAYIKLSWYDRSTNEDNFIIERGTDGTNFTPIATVPSYSKSGVSWYPLRYRDSTAIRGTTYYYRFRSSNSAGVSGPTYSISSRVLPLPISAPIAPTVASIYVNSTSTPYYIKIRWQDNSTDEAGFIAERSTDGVNFSQIAGGFYSNTIEQTGFTFPVRDYSTIVGPTYYYRLKAYNLIGTTESSIVTLSIQSSPPPLPTAPNLYIAFAQSTSTPYSVKLSFTDRSNNEDGFRILRSENGTLGTTTVDTLSSQSGSGSSLKYFDTSAVLGTVYRYQVGAFNSAGSALSSTLRSDLYDIIRPPSNLVAINNPLPLRNRILLGWQDNAANIALPPDSYSGSRIERSTSPDMIGSIKQFSVPRGITSFEDKYSLATSTTYYYRVYRYSWYSRGYSNIASAVAEAMPPALPNLTILGFDSPLNVTAGQNVTLRAWVWNAGTVSSLPSKLLVALSRTTDFDNIIAGAQATLDVPVISPSSHDAEITHSNAVWISWSTKIPEISPASIYFMAKTDPDNQIVESSETDNSSGTEILVTSLPPPTGPAPDLIIESLKVVQNYARVGRPLSFTAIVRNQGSVKAENVAVKLSVLDPQELQLTSEESAKIIKPNQQDTIRWQNAWTPKLPIGYAVSVCADPLNVIAETNELNNCVSRLIMVSELRTTDSTLPDLVVEDVDITPNINAAGKTMSISARVRNQGKEKSNSVDTRLTLLKNVKGNIVVNEIVSSSPIQSNSRDTIRWKKAWVAEPGEYSYEICTDVLQPTDTDKSAKTKESNEFNNCVNGTFMVAGVEVVSPTSALEKVTVFLTAPPAVVAELSPVLVAPSPSLQTLETQQDVVETPQPTLSSPLAPVESIEQPAPVITPEVTSEPLPVSVEPVVEQSVSAASKLSIGSASFANSTLKINGERQTFTISLTNITASKLTGVSLTAWVEQNGVKGQTVTQQITCGAGNGVVPVGSCTDTGRIGAALPLKSGSANAIFELKDSSGVLAKKSISVTITGGTAAVLGELSSLATVVNGIQGIIDEIGNSLFGSDSDVSGPRAQVLPEPVPSVPIPAPNGNIQIRRVGGGETIATAPQGTIAYLQSEKFGYSEKSEKNPAVFRKINANWQYTAMVTDIAGFDVFVGSCTRERGNPDGNPCQVKEFAPAFCEVGLCRLGTGVLNGSVTKIVFKYVKSDVVPPRTQCNDGIDNDGDGLVDYPDDPGCESSRDGDEANPGEGGGFDIQFMKGTRITPEGVDVALCAFGGTVRSFPIDITLNGIYRALGVPKTSEINPDGTGAACGGKVFPYSDFGLDYSTGKEYIAAIQIDPKNIYKEVRDDDYDNLIVVRIDGTRDPIKVTNPTAGSRWIIGDSPLGKSNIIRWNTDEHNPESHRAYLLQGNCTGANLDMVITGSDPNCKDIGTLVNQKGEKASIYWAGTRLYANGMSFYPQAGKYFIGLLPYSSRAERAISDQFEMILNPRADLAVETVYASDGSDPTIVVTPVVRNLGAVASGKYKIKVTADPLPIYGDPKPLPTSVGYEKAYGSLPGGQYAPKDNFFLLLNPGTSYQITATVVPLGVDARKDNNMSATTVRVSGTPIQNKPPTISSVSGPPTLVVGQEGTWTVSAKDPENDILKYSVIWGDEVLLSKPIPAPAARSVEQTATFTHVYATEGDYSPIFIVTDEGGLSVKTSITVCVGTQCGSKVSQVTVIFPNDGEVFIQGKERLISWRGGKGTVQVGIVRGDARLDSTIANYLVGWITTSASPDSSAPTKFLDTCDLTLKVCTSLRPGLYKIIVVSQDADGNYILWDNYNDRPGNVDLSDSAFGLKNLVTRPRVSMRMSPTVQSQNIAAGASDVLFGEYILDATESRDNVRFTSLPLRFSYSLGPAALSRCRLYDDATALTTGINEVDTSSASNSGDELRFSFDSPGPKVLAGTSKIIRLRCNVASFVERDSTYSWGLPSAASAINTTNESVVPVVILPGAPPVMTVKTPAVAMSVSSAVRSHTVKAGTASERFAEFVLDATQSSENIIFEKIPLKLMFSGLSTALQNCRLENGKSFLTTGVNQINPEIVSGQEVTFVLDDPGEVFRGTRQTVGVQCDVRLGTPAGSTYSWGLPDALTGVGSMSGSIVQVDMIPGEPPVITVGSPSPKKLTMEVRDEVVVVGEETTVKTFYGNEFGYEPFPSVLSAMNPAKPTRVSNIVEVIQPEDGKPYQTSWRVRALKSGKVLLKACVYGGCETKIITVINGKGAFAAPEDALNLANVLDGIDAALGRIESLLDQ